MATTGSDAIAEVSKVFGQLADEGGAASDSFDALNNILKNNLNRSFIKFSKNLIDINRSLGLQNKAIKEFTKNLTKGVQVPARSRSKKESGTISGTPKQPKSAPATKDPSSANLTNTLYDLADSMKNPLISVINDAGNALSGLLTTIGSFGSMISSVVSLKALFEVSELQKARKDEASALAKANKAEEDLIKEKERALAIEQESVAIREADNKKVEDAASAVEALQEMITDHTMAISNNNDQMAEATKELEALKEALRTTGNNAMVVSAVLKQKFNTIGEAADAVAARYEYLQNNTKALNDDINGWSKSLTDARWATVKLTEDQIKQQAAMAAISKNPELFKGDAGKEAGELVKKHSGALGLAFTKLKSIMTILSRFISGTLLVSLLSIVGVLTMVGKYMISLAQNAVPQMIEFLVKPLQEFHDIVTGPLKRSFDTLTGFVAKLNPAYAEMASRALDDLSAIIGRIVLPIFITMVNLLKIFNNALFNNSKLFTDVIKEFSKQLGDIGIVVMSEFFNLLTALVPVLSLLTESFKKVGPKLSGLAKKLGDVFMKHLPTVMKVIDSLANIIEMYLNMKLQEFANTAALAAHAAQNNARAMELFGKETMTLSMLFNNLGYFVSEFMLQLEGAIIELMGYISWFIGKKGDDARLGKIVEDVQKNPMNALDRGNIPLLENIQLEVAAGDDEEWEKLNIGEKAGAATRKWIAGLFGAEDMPWVQNKKKIKEEQPEAGGGEFEGDFGGVDIGGEDGLKEGFAAKGAQFQEIGELGKNLMQAAFGGGESVDEQQLDQLKQMNEKFQAMIDGQNQFNGMVPQQGVR